MQVVCLQEEAFYALFDKVVEHIELKRQDKLPKWIDGEEAMLLLETSPTNSTLLDISNLSAFALRYVSSIPFPTITNFIVG